MKASNKRDDIEFSSRKQNGVNIGGKYDEMLCKFEFFRKLLPFDFENTLY